MIENFGTWLTAFKSGKREAINALYEGYRPSFVQWMVQNYPCVEEEAIDIFQESIIVLYKNAQVGKLDKLTSRLKTYLFAIGRNIFTMRQRKHKRTVSEDVLQSAETNELGAEHKLESADRKKMIAILLKKMRNPCQELLYLFFYRRYSAEAVQKVMNYRTIDVVRTQKKRCIRALEKQLSKHFKRADI